MADTKKKTKESKKSVKPSVKKMVQNLLMQHPEVSNNARHLFHNQNGQTIIEDRVPRGDVKREDVGQPFSQYDFTDTDLRELAKYASDIVDVGILRYDERTAHEDALHRAINEKDGGKYAGKVNASTFTLLLSNVKPTKKASEKSYGDSDKTQSTNKFKEGPMSSEKEIKALETKLASLKKKNTLEKVASILVGLTAKVREQFKAIMKSASEEAKKDTKEEEKEEEKEEDKDAAAKPEEGKPGHEEAETKAEEKKEKEVVHDATVVAELDSIAGELESSGDFDLFKIAYQLDVVADVLEGKKIASALESEPDEKYMRDAFNSTIRQKDSDEKYMESFSKDKTQEVSKAYSKRPYGIVK